MSHPIVSSSFHFWVPRGVQDNETSYLESISTAMALHTRYPGHGGHTAPPGSQLQRTLLLIDNFCDQC